jgi:SAM-dependent methyltransferase
MALAEDLGDTGEVVGIDVSETMLRVARLNAQATRCPMRFTVGDARSIDEPDKSFDAARSERTLQWLADPAAAVAELVRVVRPSGRISLIDTDWSTFTLDVGDEALAVLVHRALSTEQQRASNVGRRLQDLLRAAGCLVVARTHATQTWTTWDPDRSPAPPGCFSMESLADDLVAARPRCRRPGSPATRASTSAARVCRRPAVRPPRAPPRPAPQPDPRAR